MKRNKDYIIAVGERLFRKQGYHNTGTEELLQESEYPRSSFYHHFKSKEGFAISVLENYGYRAEQFYRSVLSNEALGTPLERLKQFAFVMIDTATNREFKSECLIQKLTIEIAGNNNSIRETADKEMARLLFALEVCISAAQNAGEIRSKLNPKEVAELIHAQWYGGYILSRLQNNGEVMRNNLEMIFEYIESELYTKNQ